MKILIVHASAGAGHLKAAEAIYNRLKENSNHNVTFLDALDLTAPSFKNLYRGTYVNLISYVPWLWGFVFGLIDIPFLQPLIRGFRRIYNSLNIKGLHDLLIKEQYDYIITTHFMPTEIGAALKRKGAIKTKIITVVTDYDVHRIWIAEGVDTYAVATPWTKEKVKALGVDESKILISGIPTDERFSQEYDISQLKAKLGLDPEVFTVLIATGSFGIGPIEEVVEALDGIQSIVVSGHNNDLFERLKKRDLPLVKAFGLVDNMFELMAVSDAMVTKPGGLSISEALVSDLPLIFFNPIPGQETGNIRVLAQHGVGVRPANTEEISKELKKLNSSKEEFQTILNNTKALARPSAAEDIIKLIT